MRSDRSNVAYVAQNTAHYDVVVTSNGMERHEKRFQVVHQMDARGNHRLCVLVTVSGIPQEAECLCGDWAPYQSIVSVTHLVVGEFLGFTDYHGERVIRASPCLKSARQPIQVGGRPIVGTVGKPEVVR